MVCLDTTTLIDFLKGEAKAIAMVQGIEWEGERVSITAPTVLEIARGLDIKHLTAQEKVMTNEFINTVNILDLDCDAAILAGAIETDLQRSGMTLDLADIMIGAIAIVNDEMFITRNVKHFKGIKGLKVMSYCD